MLATATGIWNYTQFDSVSTCDLDTDICTLSKYISAYVDSILILTIVPIVLIIIAQILVC